MNLAQVREANKIVDEWNGEHVPLEQLHSSAIISELGAIRFDAIVQSQDEREESEERSSAIRIARRIDRFLKSVRSKQ